MKVPELSREHGASWSGLEFCVDREWNESDSLEQSSRYGFKESFAAMASAFALSSTPKNPGEAPSDSNLGFLYCLALCFALLIVEHGNLSWVPSSILPTQHLH